MDWERVFKAIAAAFGALAGYLWGGWSTALDLLLAFVVIDYISGIIAAGMESRLSSSIGYRGILKKVSIFIIVAAAHLVDCALGTAHTFREAAAFFYMANELLSIVENAGRIGLPVPGILQQAIEVLRKKGDVDGVSSH